MSKRLTNKEKAYIKKHMHTMSITDISKILNRTQICIKNNIEKLKKEEIQELAQEELTEDASKPDTELMQLIGTREDRSVAIMNQAASMKTDALKKHAPRLPSSRYKNCIQILNKNKPVK